MPKKGYKQTEEHIRKHVDKIRGENNGNWKDGIKINNPNYLKDWIDENRERMRHFWFLNKQKRRLAKGFVSLKEWRGLKEKYGNECLCCRRREPEIKLQKDHIIPIKLGGLNIIDNIQPLCDICNRKKFIKVEDYR